MTTTEDARAGLIAVLRRIRDLLSEPEGRDFVHEIAEVDGFIRDLESGADRQVRSIGVLFYPTCDLQDIAIRCGWGDEYCRLADRAEALVPLLIPKSPL
ncbi:MAG TPA: hypothetical protein VM222_06155 [Planctomycetota bacterium]|nr:hypothetical protein [Planctomycetota bacterium]